MAQKVKYITFMEAMKALDDGKHIRPSDWKSKYILKNDLGHVVCSDGYSVILQTNQQFYIVKKPVIKFQWRYYESHAWIVCEKLMNEEEAKKYFNNRLYEIYEKHSGPIDLTR